MKRRRDAEADAEAHGKRRKPPSEDDVDDHHQAEAPRRQELFDDARMVGSYRCRIDKRLAKAVAAISLEMLEDVRLTQHKLLHILEHPRCEEYLIGAYVRYPDLEEIENGEHAVDEYHMIPPLPAQITKLQNLESAVAGVMESGERFSIMHEMSIIQYTQRSDGSLKIRKGKMSLDLVQNSSFTQMELAKWQTLLRLFTGRPGAEKLRSLPDILITTATKLRAFTFTDEDVNEVLKRKMTQSGPYSYLAALNFRDLFIRKAELDHTLKELSNALEEERDMSPEEIKPLKERMEEVQAELAAVNDRVEQQKKEKKALEELHNKRDVGAFALNANDKGSKHDDCADYTALRQTWKKLRWAIAPPRLSWKNPLGYLDVAHRISCESSEEWFEIKRMYAALYNDSTLRCHLKASLLTPTRGNKFFSNARPPPSKLPIKSQSETAPPLQTEVKGESAELTESNSAGTLVHDEASSLTAQAVTSGTESVNLQPNAHVPSDTAFHDDASIVTKEE